MLQLISRAEAYTRSPLLEALCAWAQRCFHSEHRNQIEEAEEFAADILRLTEQVRRPPTEISPEERRAAQRDLDDLDERGWDSSFPLEAERQRREFDQCLHYDLIDLVATDTLYPVGASLALTDLTSTGFPERLGTAVAALLEHLAVEQLVIAFPCSAPDPWQFEVHDAPELAESARVLRDLGVAPDHQGALQADLGGLRALVPCLYWFARCVPSTYAWIVDQDDRIALEITKYGTLQARLPGCTAADTVIQAAAAVGFEEAD